jgi:hypothetical protein
MLKIKNLAKTSDWGIPARNIGYIEDSDKSEAD